MPDPSEIVTTAVLAGMGTELGKKVLGRSMTLAGDVFRGLNDWQKENVERILTKGESKLGNVQNDDGAVHPKILNVLLNQGSWNDEELAAEYFGGVLASSKTGVFRDDRG